MELFQVEVGSPLTFHQLSVFPLFSSRTSGVDYLLVDEAVPDGGVVVEEVSEAGSVPNLKVENRTDRLVLFLEGEELVGARQNRVLNTSLLVAAGGQAQIPVSCVEQGRWRFTSRQFASGSHSSSKLRMALKASVASSLRQEAGHRSDQSAVWAEVSRQQSALDTNSATAAMSDTMIAHAEGVERYRDQLPFVKNSSGLAVAIGAQLVAVDLFDKPATCEKIWKRLLSGYILEAFEAKTAGLTDIAAVESLLAELNALPWTPAAAACEGKELRTAQGDRLHGSALLYDDTLIHASVMLAS
ncbi:ARPP-1 family domain-containing protein [Lignipirellula cremea]|uniref:ARG and Rhodanese-Phosphatase-superfamily-associated domain-containing protein n=1 Tax=Lignipirellula cremea TaxID=2528010 RepID=A0A518DND2_9BACT|nr:DUF6569 family protein [Lignipirellula cremea]QDU93346.1 hypothetical protein Pla8534_11260 [Lignipirellula cremea]